MMTNQKECARCISDTSIPDIRFDANGICNYCKIHDKLAEQFPLTDLDFDNSWDTDMAITTMKNAVTKLDIDLKTVTCDWAEYKALQLSFFKASVPDAELANRFLRIG